MIPDNEYIVFQKDDIKLFLLKGKQALPFIDIVANFRINVFKEFPYLYEGNIEDERGYITSYTEHDDANIILIYKGDSAIGFSSSLPLSMESEYITDVIKNAGLDINDYLYLGEAIINKEYRGIGILNNIIDIHTSEAKKLNLSKFCFMAVLRDSNHPNTPKDDNYIANEVIFSKKGFSPINDCYVNIEWKNCITGNMEENTLQFYTKDV